MAEMLTCILMWLGRWAAARVICLSFQIGQILRTFTISATTKITGRHVGFEGDYNYPTTFRASYVITHKVYYTIKEPFSMFYDSWAFNNLIRRTPTFPHLLPITVNKVTSLVKLENGPLGPESNNQHNTEHNWSRANYIYGMFHCKGLSKKYLWRTTSVSMFADDPAMHIVWCNVKFLADQKMKPSCV